MISLSTSLKACQHLTTIESLPTSNDNGTILVVVDGLSKFAHFLTLTHLFTIESMAENFVKGGYQITWSSQINH